VHNSAARDAGARAAAAAAARPRFRGGRTRDTPML